MSGRVEIYDCGQGEWFWDFSYNAIGFVIQEEHNHELEPRA